MKKFFHFLILITYHILIFNVQSAAQAPKMMNYQGVARDGEGQTLVNKQINLKLSIISANNVNDAVYKEEQLVTTNEFGLFAIKIGEGTALAGSMDAIDWGSADHFISVEMDAENTGHYAFMGSSQLLSVPYAFYAETAGKATNLENADQLRAIDFSGTNGQTIRHNGSDWEASSTLYNNGTNIGLGTTSPAAKLDVSGNVNLSLGNEITFGGDRALAMDANRNIMQGRQTGNDLTSGVNNNMIGYRAGWKTTTGSNNSIIGYQAGYTNTTGSSNMFLGYKAGYLNTTGSNNFYGGLQAGYGSTTGQNNIALGSNAGYSVADANNNIFVGRNSGYQTTANENVFIGYEAGYDNTTGTQNTYIGTGADGSANLTNATAIGANALVEANNSLVLGNAANVGIGTTTPENKLHVKGNIRVDSARVEFVNTGNSVFIGEDAGLNDDFTDNRNIAIGTSALKTNTSGAYNVAIGGEAMTNTTTGGYNVAVGDLAINNNTTGRSNVGIGYAAIYFNTTGSHNVALGEAALVDNTEGQYNLAIGSSALSDNTTGGHNIAVGVGALGDNTTGSENVSIGTSSLDENETGKRNTALGYSAGYRAKGDSNIFIGYRAGYNETGSHKLYIENSNADSSEALIYGEFDNKLLAINGTLRVNNGTQADGYVLTSDADGNANWEAASSPIFDISGGAVIPGSAVDETSDDFVFGSTQLNDDGDIDHDTRFFFSKDFGAFRAGSVTDNTWNTNSLGFYSFASGYNTKASGDYSIALGSGAVASGEYSIAMGFTALASGNVSVAFGNNTAAEGDYSTAMGLFTGASGYSSTALGNTSVAEGDYSTAMGKNTTASGSYSTVMGYFTTAPSSYETTIGRYNTSYTPNSTLGWNTADRLFTIGNGTGSSAQSDALVILKSGEIGIGTSTPDTTLHVVGQIKYDDGNQADGYVLTSDANGNASWEAPSFSSVATNAITLQDGCVYAFEQDAQNLIGDYQDFAHSGLWQSFTALNTGHLGSIEINMSSATNAAVCKLVIYDGEGTSIPLDSIELPGYYPAGWNSFDVSSLEIAIEEGQLYTFEIGGAFSIQRSSSNVYEGGGTNPYIGSWDLAFKVYTRTCNNGEVIALSPDSTGVSVNGVDTLNFSDGTYLTSGYINTVTDTDNDTKIQVEESSDEDLIRFDIEGREFFRMREGRLEFANTNRCIFIGEGTNTQYPSSGFFYNNQAIGDSTLNSMYLGEGNIAIGTSAMYNANSGDYNVVIGYNAGRSLLNSDNENTMIGNKTGYNNKGSGNVFLGNKAGYYEVNNNKLYIENSDATSSEALIYGEFDNDLLKVNGELRVSNTLEVSTTVDTAEAIILSLKSSSGRYLDILAPDIAEINDPFVFYTANEFLFRVDAHDALTIDDNDGNVGVGTTAPTSRLDIFGNTRKDLTLQISDNDDEQGIAFQNSAGSYSWNIYRTPNGNNTSDLRFAGNASGSAQSNIANLNEYFTLQAGGNVGVGTTNPVYKLQVNGQVAGTSAFVNTSDAKYKTNVQPIGSALSKIGQLQGVSYDWKTDEFPEMQFDERKQLGFIAQDVEAIVPEAVSINEKGDYGLSYTTFTPILVEAIKELSDQVHTLQKENETLKAQLLEEKTTNQSRLERLEAELGIGASASNK